MKHVLVCLFVWIVTGAAGLLAQTGKSEYLFDHFSDAVVIYKDGRQFLVRINYNLVDKRYVFYDQADKDELKIFQDTRLVGAIKVGDRVFRIASKGEAEEILRPEPFLSVVYTARLKEPPKQAAYGGTSETNAIQSVSTFQGDGITRNLHTGRLTILSVAKIYSSDIKGKTKTFRNASQFVKLYPKQKDRLESYIKEKRIDFNDPAQVILLCNYADSLQ